MNQKDSTFSIVFYDGNCSLCCEQFEFWSPGTLKMQWLDFRVVDFSQKSNLLTQELLESSVCVLQNEKVFTEIDALSLILKDFLESLRIKSRWLHVFFLPVLFFLEMRWWRFIFQPVYRMISRNRQRLSCRGGACEIRRKP